MISVQLSIKTTKYNVALKLKNEIVPTNNHVDAVVKVKVMQRLEAGRMIKYHKRVVVTCNSHVTIKEKSLGFNYHRLAWQERKKFWSSSFIEP
eukprot:g43225.t1